MYCTEVEAVLHAHPLIASAAVFGIPSAVMGELVAAAVVMKTTAESPKAGTPSGPRSAASAVAGTVEGSLQHLVAELTEWCRSRLAQYKVPHQVRGNTGQNGIVLH